MTNEIEQDCQLYSDLYKDLYGMRPNLERFRNLPAACRQEVIEDVSARLAEEIDAEDLAEPYDAYLETLTEEYDDPFPDHGMIGGDSDLLGEW